MAYFYHGIQMKKHWLNDRISLSPAARTHFGCNKPHRINEKNIKSLRKSVNIDATQVDTCDGTDITALNGQQGLYSKEKVAKNANVAVVLGMYVSSTEYNIIFKRGKNTFDYKKYCISFEDDNGKTWTVIPNIDKFDNWVYCNDGWRGNNHSNIANCEFTWSYIDKLPVLFITTRKAINTGSQLLCEYGQNYWDKYAEKK